MDPLAADPSAAASPLYTTPAEDALLGTTLFAMVEVAKAVFGIEGRVRLVRGMTLCFALVLAFGNALFGSETVPHLTGYLCWQTFLRALMTTFAAFGLNSVRDRGQQMQAAATERRDELMAERREESEAGADVAAEASRLPVQAREASAAPDMPAEHPEAAFLRRVRGLHDWAGYSEGDARVYALTNPEDADAVIADALMRLKPLAPMAAAHPATPAPAPAPAPAKPITKAAALRAANEAAKAAADDGPVHIDRAERV